MKRLIAVIIALGMLGVALPVLGAYSGNQNTADYWEAHYSGHNAVCFKHTGNSAHGRIVDSDSGYGEAVVLNSFNQNWPGDHWEALIIKAGSENSRQNPVQRVVIDHPSANTKYDAPIGGNQKVKDVSHWIVCKGEAPPTTTTSSTSSTTSTTSSTTSTSTTVPETTTTTQPTTTTTEQEPEAFCVDANTATLDQLIQVNGLDLVLGQSVIDARSFDKPIQDTLQSVSGIGPVSVLAMLEPDLPNHPGYISDECLTVETTDSTTSTTSTTVPPTTQPPATTPTILPFTGQEDIYGMDADLVKRIAGVLGLVGIATVGLARRLRGEVH